MSIICPVCIEPLIVSSDNQIVSTPCGHVFHSHCLHNWLNEKTSCPTCRNKVKESHIKKLYLEFATLSSGHSAEVASYVCQVESLSFEVKMKNKDVQTFKERALKDEALKRALREEVSKIESRLRKVKCNYTDAINFQESLRSEIKSLRQSVKEMDKLKEDLENYKRLDSILYGSIETADSVLKSNDMDPDHLIMLVSSFKTAYEDAKQSVMKKDKIIHKLTTENVSYKSKLENLSSQISILERVVETYKDKSASDKSLGLSSCLLETSQDSEQFSSAFDPSSSSGKTPDVATPKFCSTESFKKFSLKRKQETSPLLNRKIKIVSSRLKRPQNT